MEINGVEIEDTFAEAFPIKIGRVLITAATKRWAEIAATEATGFGTSVIMCPAEAGIERFATCEETPDGRPGVYIQICTFKFDALEQQLLERIGQCILTAPTTAVFNGLPDAEKQFNIGAKERFFGDGLETIKQLADHKMHSIPLMGGDFLIEENIGAITGIAGGNFFIFGDSQMTALTAAEVAVDAIREIEGTITPFPGGIVASGSKSGSNKYAKFMKATVNEKFCPTIRNKVPDTQIPADVKSVYEIVINGLNEEAIKKAMAIGIKAAVTVPGVKKITAGNYDGKLGKYQFRLHDLF
ncbi:formylmethanofuran--tetrahydromethanopterin N-formyltransferase [Methanomethylovorans sp.]|uniref:formylmethanofuran--tetrahydromethanopterin N-formyltransferase n=1 Tax=Methanomethylovorans sp. TaxID=2758717 RepID=UPI00345EDA35